MNKDELKSFVKEECGDPALGICDVSDLSDSQVDALKKTNTTQSKIQNKHIISIMVYKINKSSK